MKTGSSRGQILRVKHGYNPNSSSMGSLIYALPVSLMAIGAAFSLISSLILPRFLRDRPDAGGSSPTEPPDEGEVS